MSLLHTLCVEVTARCPLRCIHCSANAAPERLEFLDPQRFEQRLRELGSLSELYLSGGEPFEHQALGVLVRAARAVTRNVIIYTSGVRMGPAGNEPLPVDVLMSVAQAGASRIDVSLYAAQAEGHDSVTQVPGSFDHTLETLRRLRTVGIPFGVHHVLFGGTRHVREVVGLTQNLGAARLHLLALAPHGRGRSLGDAILPEATLADLRWLSGQPRPFELILSSGLRRMLGTVTPTPRDVLRPALLDVRGFLYPSEGLRLPLLRSRSSLHERPILDLMAELPAV